MKLLVKVLTLARLSIASASRLKQLGLLLLLSLVLSGCNDLNAPIEADDFGFPKLTIVASGQNVTGEKENELSEWTSSGYKYNGNGTVSVMVYNNSGTFSIWSSWNGNGENILTSSMISADKCVIPAYCAVPTAKFETITNAPCNFTKGQGLYMLLTNPSNTLVSDPNQYPNINRMPAIGNFFTTGLWNSTGMYQNGSLASGYLGAINPTYTNGEAYFKILDRYYDDNSGAFFVSLKKKSKN